MNSARLPISLLALVAVGGYSATPLAHAAPPRASAKVTSNRAEPTSVPTGVGERNWLVETPDAPVSALRDPNNPKTSIQARARVVVRASARGPVDAQAAKVPGSRVAAVDPTGAALTDFWIVDVATVSQAIALARACRTDAQIAEAYVDTKRSTLRGVPTDPMLSSQWYVNNTVTPEADLNLFPAWMADVTGAGITVGIIDEGQNAAHPDLAATFHAAASQTDAGSGSHATACAGLVAMAPNNAKGGAGVAFGARHARLYYGFDTDNATAFLHRNDLNHIKTNSWGPTDNGSIGEITSVELAALESSALAGRGGKGVVICWAGGNGRGANGDRADYDQYASSRFAICVGSIDNADRLASYSESGSSVMVVTQSSFDFFGSGGSGVFSATGFATAGDGDYTPSFGGTSASSPIASGVCALLLEVNPNLSWRDVQHVLIRTARKVNPTDEGWSQNGAGRWVNLDYGFGAIDAGAAVALAQTFPPVAAEQSFASPVNVVNLPIADNDLVGVTSTLSVPTNLKVERAQIVLNAPHGRIGDLRIELTSPSGTTSLFADTRVDFSPGYNNFTFTTVRSWDESSSGTWTLRIKDLVAGATGTLNSWQLKIFGTPACSCDWDGSGSLTPQDIFNFLNAWFMNTGDFNGDTFVTPQDIFDFLNCWFTGC